MKRPFPSATTVTSLSFIAALLPSVGFSGANPVTLEEDVHFSAELTDLGRLARFTISTSADVELKAPSGVNTVQIKPGKHGVPSTIRGETVRLEGVAPGSKIAVTFDDNHDKPTYLFADPPPPDQWNSLPADTIRFGPGRHRIGRYEIKGDDVTIFLEEGAVVEGYFIGRGNRNVRILGYGTIDGRKTKRAVRFERGRNIEIRGPVLLSRNGWTCAFFECDGVNIHNIKILASEVFSDGIDILATSNVVIGDVFIRNEDDCIAIKTKKWSFAGNVENVSVSNSVFWSGVRGNGLEIGWELDGDYVRNIRFEDIDIIRKETFSHPFKRAALSIHHVGNCRVSDVLYKDIRIESVDENLIWIEQIIPAENSTWGSGGGTIENIRFENISYAKGNDVPVVIVAREKGGIKNVSFKNLAIKGRSVVSPADPVFQLKHTDITVQ